MTSDTLGELILALLPPISFSPQYVKHTIDRRFVRHSGSGGGRDGGRKDRGNEDGEVFRLAIDQCVFVCVCLQPIFITSLLPFDPTEEETQEVGGAPGGGADAAAAGPEDGGEDGVRTENDSPTYRDAVRARYLVYTDNDMVRRSADSQVDTPDCCSSSSSSSSSHPPPEDLQQQSQTTRVEAHEIHRAEGDSQTGRAASGRHP